MIKRHSETVVRFYRIPVSCLVSGNAQRERILKSTSFPTCSLKQVDLSLKKVVIERDQVIQVWDLASESLDYSVAGEYNRNTWYSRGQVISTVFEDGCTIFYITDLSGTSRKAIKILSNSPPVRAEVIGKNLMVVFQGIPMLLIDLTELKAAPLSRLRMKFYMEMESLNDGLALLEDGTARLLSRPEVRIPLRSTAPYHTDTKDCIITLDSGILTVVSNEGELLESKSLGINETVSEIGVNEDTMDIYVACKSGKILLVQ